MLVEPYSVPQTLDEQRNACRLRRRMPTRAMSRVCTTANKVKRRSPLLNPRGSQCSAVHISRHSALARSLSQHSMRPAGRMKRCGCTTTALTVAGGCWDPPHPAVRSVRSVYFADLRRSANEACALPESASADETEQKRQLPLTPRTRTTRNAAAL